MLYFMISCLASTRYFIPLTKYMAIPVLILNMLMFYMVTLFENDSLARLGFYVVQKYPIHFGLFEATIAIHFYLIKHYTPESILIKSSSQCTLLLLLLSQNLIRVSIAVIFLVGLSGINLFHTVFIVASLIFMLNFNLALRYWKILIVYTMAYIVLSYFWVLLLPLVDLSDYGYLGNFLGLPTSNDLAINVFPSTSFLWLLLSVVLVQHREFQMMLFPIEYTLTVKQILKRKWCFLESLLKCIEAPSNSGIWLGYFLVYLIISMSTLNLLNFVRLAVISLCLGVHLFDYKKDLINSQKKTRCFWLGLELYSGLLLVIRYIYQFIYYVPAFPLMEFPVIGIGVYSLADIYINMIPDCSLLLISVIVRRSCFKVK